MKSNKLSVVLATYNEQVNIKTCLNSVKGLADEIIIVDGSSQDQTRIIARKMGAKVFKVKNLSMFHTNKQKAVDKATYPWILQLDADEQVSPELKTEIKSVIVSPKAKDGYYLPRKNFFLNRFLTKGGQYPDYVIRLFKKGQGRFPQKTVHEQIKIDGSVDYLKHDLLHYSDPTFSRYLERFNRYTGLEAKLMLDSNLKPTFFIGISYLIIKPIAWFLLTYFRHKGFIDGLPGFIFSLMSSLRFPVTFFKFVELYYENRH